MFHGQTPGRSPAARAALALALLLIVESTSSGQALVARQIVAATASEDVFGGSDAFGGIDDWYLSNGVVEAIIDNVGFQSDIAQSVGALVPIRDYGFTGGSLIDLGHVGADNDQFNWLAQFANIEEQRAILYVPAGSVLGNSSLPAVIAKVDAVAAKASLKVYGFVFYPQGSLFNKKIFVETEYSMLAGESTLHLKTTLTNKSTRVVDIDGVGDITLLAHGGLLPFAPYPGRGFGVDGTTIVFPFVSFVGRVGPGDGVMDTAASTNSGEVSYTLLSLEQVFLAGSARLNNPHPILFSVGVPPSPRQLNIGEKLAYVRQIEVGRRNDVASSLNAALPKLAPAFGASIGVVRGRLVASDGMPIRASVDLTLLDRNESTPAPDTFLSLLNGDNRPQPISHVATNSAAGGEFQAILPAGRHQLRVIAEERNDIPPMNFSVPAGSFIDLGDVALASKGRLSFRVTDTSDPGGPGIPAKITIQGLKGTPNPTFGVPFSMRIEGIPATPQGSHSNPGLHMAYSLSGEGELFVRPGDYRVYASRGLEYDIDTADIVIGPGETRHLDFSLSRVVDTSGFVSADFHVHSARSPDSSVPPSDRVINFAAEGVEVIVGTEHNFTFDYQPLIESLGLSSRMRSMAGVEMTTGRAEVAGRVFPSFGHWNAWPQSVSPFARKDGSPEEAYVEPSVLIDRARERGAEVVQLDHPWWETIGFLRNLGYDPTQPITHGDNAFLLRQAITGTGTRNLDFDAIELYNGTGPFAAFATSRATWFSLLNQGINKVGTAVTDTHFIAVKHGGFPRSYVASNVADMSQFDATVFNDSLKQMKVIGTSGPYLSVQAQSDGNIAGLGDTLTAVSGNVDLRVQVQAACWIPVEEVRVFGNGVLITQIPLASSCPPVMRFDLTLPYHPTRDTYYVVEAGQNMGPSALEPPPLPQGAMSVIEPLVRSLAFTNPIFVDVDGNGVFDPPGLNP